MPQPAKPASVLKSEGKSHRTKKELEYREKMEASLTTGQTFKMTEQVRKNDIAKAEFRRISKLLEKIGKNDALIQNSINRYCLMYSELVEFEEKREEFYQGILDLKKTFEEEQKKEENKTSLKIADYFMILAKMETALINLDKQVMNKRKMLLDLEKENIMTISAQLRTIPKTADDMPAESDDMAALFASRGDN